jgi:hypothetical protein
MDLSKLRTLQRLPSDRGPDPPRRAPISILPTPGAYVTLECPEAFLVPSEAAVKRT